MRRCIVVVAYPSAGKEEVQVTHEGGEEVWRVWVKEPAEKGRANKAVCRAVARRLGVAPSCVEVAHGTRGRKKLLRVVCDLPSSHLS